VVRSRILTNGQIVNYDGDVATRSTPYHHGSLRSALIGAATETIADTGPAATSLREVARRAGVTHPAAIYHFGDKAGLLTAVAVEGYRLLSEALTDAKQHSDSFLEVGVAYVRFAVEHQAHFEVMYRPELYRPEDPELRRARAAAAAALYGSGRPDQAQLQYGVAAWAMVHGIATLWLNGNLPKALGSDPEAIARVIAAHLRAPPRRQRPAGHRK
jgi:AcrR family transcriptional regulator